jgi:hydrogenase nickel incorporation protein HypA/HybF
MHELSIAEEIISITKQYLSKEDNFSVKTIKVKIGKLSNVLPDSLEFCYYALIDDTLLKGSKLEIENIPITIECEDCREISKVDDTNFLCSKCNSSFVRIISGSEMLISEIELND